ncbi:MAG: DUF6036 family nucleotidyltransferase [Candidatus Dormiibacterota bacterium]
MISSASLEAVLSALGATLAERGLAYEVVVVGGSALLLLGLTARPTRDVDVVAIRLDGDFRKPGPLPQMLLEAAADAARTFGLREDWLNAGPADLMDFGLPEGFADRLQAKTYGGLIVQVIGRADQIALKLYAAADHGRDSRHAQDLRSIEPTEWELLESGRWAMTHDPSPGFRSELVAVLSHMGIKDADRKL